MASRLTRLAPLTRLARPLAISQRNPTVRSLRYASNSPDPFQSMPSPPRLPADQQAEFERLQRTANTQAGFNPTSTPDFTSPDSSAAAAAAAAAAATTTPAIEEGGEFAPVPLRKGAPPEFEGDVNPKTGEVGGPKNEPLRWGASGDYSFNGRVTDF
ncbi:anthranilate synthase / indole-3-glycerol phosphate synthase [Hypoxylon texense]